jgi:nitrogen fixation/metabolism regulation signal transduction histidine kinase
MLTDKRRRRYLVHNSLQLRYAFYIIFILVTVTVVSTTGSYYGIWGSVIKSVSSDSIKNAMVTAALMNEYEQARRPLPENVKIPTMRLFKETELFAEWQLKVIEDIMEETTRQTLLLSLVLIILIGWGSIYLTHKIAGPIFKTKQLFGKIKEGDLTVRIHFRKHDQLHDLTPAFNEMVASLDNSVSHAKQVVHDNPQSPLAKQLAPVLERFKTTMG